MSHDRLGRDPLYVEARRVLLDALSALSSHLPALVVVGAQAVYLRTAGLPDVNAPFTRDGDLVLDPALLADEPQLAVVMEAAGFRLKRRDGHPQPGIWLASATIGGVADDVPLDLIVPDGALAPSRRRGARLGPHGKHAAQRIPGLEAALVDHSPMHVAALDPADARAYEVNVAGTAALLIAKAHKLAGRARDRHRRPDRFQAKDAEDVLRLFEATDAREVAETCARLREHAMAGPTAAAGLRYLAELFGRRGGLGIEQATYAQRADTDPRQIEVRCLAYMRVLTGAL
jgi:hypothetical protein